MNTIVDVARLAQVSIKTVSRVINDRDSVRESTRERVQRAIRQLDYHPHQGARLMRGQDSGIIGLITGAIDSMGKLLDDQGLSAVQILRGAQQACHQAGKTLMIANAAKSGRDFGQLLRLFAAHSVEGIIYATDRHQQVAFPSPDIIPTVLANCFDAVGTPSVVPDDYQGQQIATEMLLDQGHHHLVMVGLQEEVVATQLRRRAFFDACRDFGLHQDHVSYQTGAASGHPDGTFGPLPSVLRTLLESRTPPSAILFGNDIMTMRGMSLLRNAGVLIPDDISIVGFDNDIRLCENLHPRLTTVGLPYVEIGRRAVAMLLDEEQAGNRTSIERVRCELVLRDSSRPPDSIAPSSTHAPVA
ncbi:MAG: LacI family DNA-binding transcriptional regulator [Rhodobacteraceae bacterium]|nr:LacI family DNA-binding transcriptional regulator [Paracoccaceae bacterium]